MYVNFPFVHTITYCVLWRLENWANYKPTAQRISLYMGSVSLIRTTFLAFKLTSGDRCTNHTQTVTSCKIKSFRTYATLIRRMALLLHTWISSSKGSYYPPIRDIHPIAVSLFSAIASTPDPFGYLGNPTCLISTSTIVGGCSDPDHSVFWIRKPWYLMMHHSIVDEIWYEAGHPSLMTHRLISQYTTAVLQNCLVWKTLEF